MVTSLTSVVFGAGVPFQDHLAGIRRQIEYSFWVDLREVVDDVLVAHAADHLIRLVDDRHMAIAPAAHQSNGRRERVLVVHPVRIRRHHVGDRLVQGTLHADNLQHEVALGEYPGQLS